MTYELKDQVDQLGYDAMCARGNAEAVEMVLCELLSILKKNSPQQFEELKKNCNDIKESTVSALGEIGEYHLEVHASSFAEKCEDIFYDESESFSEEELLRMNDPSLITSQ